MGTRDRRVDHQAILAHSRHAATPAVGRTCAMGGSHYRILWTACEAAGVLVADVEAGPTLSCFPSLAEEGEHVEGGGKTGKEARSKGDGQYEEGLVVQRGPREPGIAHIDGLGDHARRLRLVEAAGV